VRGGLEAKGLLCGLDETRQVRRLEARRTGAHVQFHTLSKHKAHPGTPLWECLRDTHWHPWYPIELRHDLGQRHAGFLQLADVDKSFQVRLGVVWSAPRAERRGQEPALDVITHSAARHPP
jgi:hypothetical protein